MYTTLSQKSLAFGMVLALVTVLFATVPIDARPTCPFGGVMEPVDDVDTMENTPQIIAREGTFDCGQGELHYVDGKPVIRLFSTTWCPHCTWITDTFDSVMTEYVRAGQIVAYHWNLDSGDNTLTEEVETEVPQVELAVFQTYNSLADLCLEPNAFHGPVQLQE